MENLCQNNRVLKQGYGDITVILYTNMVKST